MLKVSWIERISNEIILERMNSLREIMKQIRQKHLRFLGHILRKQKLESRVLTGTTGKRRPKSRPRVTYMDGLVKDLGGRYSKVGPLRSANNKRILTFHSCQRPS